MSRFHATCLKATHNDRRSGTVHQRGTLNTSQNVRWTICLNVIVSNCCGVAPHMHPGHDVHKFFNFHPHNKLIMPPRYYCDFSGCGKSFPSRSKLKIHTRTHTGEKPHKCPECNRAFAEKGKPVKHMRTHTGEKPHKCSDCDYATAEKGNLVKTCVHPHWGKTTQMPRV